MARIPRHIFAAAGFGGLQFTLMTITGHGVAHFQLLGLSDVQVSSAILLGPLCGALLPPLIGRWSDHLESKWGKRVPFIAVGAIATCIALLCIAWTRTISARMTELLNVSQSKTVLLNIMSSSLVFWTGINACQVSLRALITDGDTVGELSRANSWANVYGRAASFIANCIAMVSEHNSQSLTEATFQHISLCAVLALLSTVVISGMTTATISSDLCKRSSTIHIEKPAIRSANWKQIYIVYLTQALSWSGWFPFLFYTKAYVNQRYIQNHWFKESRGHQLILHASPGTFVLWSHSFIALLGAITMPQIAEIYKQVSLRQLWICGLVVFGLSTLLAPWTTSATSLNILFTINGLSWVITNWIPFTFLGASILSTSTLVDDMSSHTTKIENEIRLNRNHLGGRIYGMHNLAICLPQIVMSIGMVMAGRTQHITRAENGQLSDMPGPGLDLLFQFGGVLNLLAAWSAATLREL